MWWMSTWAGAWDTSPKELLALARRADPEESYTVLLDQGTIRVEGDGSVVDTLHQVIGISTATGVDAWSTVSVGWLPEFEDRPTLSARVVSPDGAEHELDPTSFVEATEPGVDPSMVEDTRLLRVVLPQVAVGSVIEIESVRRDHHPLGAQGRAWFVPLPSLDPTVRRERTYDVPESTPLRWSIDEPDPRLKVDVSDKRARGRRVIRFEQKEPTEWEWRPDLPPGVFGAPVFRVGTGRAWADVAAAYHPMVQRAMGEGEAGLERPLAELRALPEGERVAAATEIARDRVRYAAIEFGAGRIVPASPAEVLSRGYGDCKDKATLLVALLRAVGVEAELALVATRPAYVPADFPNAQVFDHAIVHLPADDRWIDPTSRFDRPGELPMFDQGQPALLVRPTGGALVTTPVQPLVLERVTSFDLSVVGGGAVVQRTRSAGPMAGEYRAQFDGVPRSEWPAVVRDRSVEWFGTDRVQVAVSPEPTGPFEVTLSVASAATAQSIEGEAWVTTDVRALSLGAPAVFDLDQAGPPTERVHPYDLLRREVSLTSEVTLPAGMVLVDPPADRVWTLGDARLARTLAVEPSPSGSRVRHEVTLDAGDGLFTPEEVTAWRSAVTTLQAEARLYARHPAWEALTAGEPGRALEGLRRPPDQDPRPAHEALLRATALAELGFEADALAELRALAARFPDLPVVVGALGRSLVEVDRAEARAVLERAMALDVDYPPITLAGLYVDEGLVEEVVALLATRAGYGGSTEDQIREHAGRALLFAGRLDEARDTLASLPDSPVTQAVRYLQTGAPMVDPSAPLLAVAAMLGHPEHDARFPELAEGAAWLRTAPTEARTPEQALALLILRCGAGEPLGAVASKGLRAQQDDLFAGCRAAEVGEGLPRWARGPVASIGLLTAKAEGHDAIGFQLTLEETRAFVQRVGDHYQVVAMDGVLGELPEALAGTGPAPAAAARFALSVVPGIDGVDPTKATHRAVLRAYLESRPGRPPKFDAEVEPALVSLAVKACQKALDWECVVAVSEGAKGVEVVRVEAFAKLGRAAEARAVIAAAPDDRRDGLMNLLDVSAGDWTAARSSARGLTDPADLAWSRGQIALGLVRAGRVAEAREELAAIPEDRRTLADTFTEALIALSADDRVGAAAALRIALAEPERSGDWAYVEARLAEAYGLVDTARAARAKIESPWVRALE
ncbi:MAG: DUF3857 domain-containing protein [Myxococcota bacterium]